MDQLLTLVRDGDDLAPPQAPLAMPAQALGRWSPGGPLPADGNRASTYMARLFVFLVTLGVTGLGTNEIYQVVSPSQATWLQILFAGLFALTFAWIAFSFASAWLGFIRLLHGRKSQVLLAHPSGIGRNVLLMPVHNEEPERIMSTLARMAAEIATLGLSRHFDIFILSDTRDPHRARDERAGFEALRRRLAGTMASWYRRRADNHHKKAGNIADFIARWGGGYDHMIVLDADSAMSGETLITLARAMAADPKAGIIQTVPLLRDRWTPYARLQQFSSRIYGPPVAEGLSAWHGREGNYWGHNAIIRVKAFAEAAGLPELPGRRPFGGHVLSHDFVEAALMRRAGWSITMLPELGGSYEEAPASLADLVARDRRWCQGNLQHLKIIASAGLHWASRVHLLQGIMSYLASPLWLLLLISGLGLSIQAQYVWPEYFPEGFALFPTWPVFDPERALRLLGFTSVILYAPKLFGLALAMCDAGLRKGCGGVSGLVRSFVVESVLSALLSPVMMLIQSRFVLDIFAGRDSGWSAQNRGEAAQPLADMARRHAGHVMVGGAIAAVAWSVSWETFLWMLPIVAGLIASFAVSWATSLPELGRWAWRNNIFRIPEEEPVPAKTQGRLVLQAAE